MPGALAVAAGTAFMVPVSAAEAIVSPTPDEVTAFTTIAQQVLERRATVLTQPVGAAVSVTPITAQGVTEAAAEVASEQTVADALATRRDLLAGTGEQYSGASIDLEAVGSDRGGGASRA